MHVADRLLQACKRLYASRRGLGLQSSMSTADAVAVVLADEEVQGCIRLLRAWTGRSGASSLEWQSCTQAVSEGC